MSDFVSGKGFEEFEKELQKYSAAAENVDQAIEAGASAFTDDLLRLPSPRSGTNKGTYTHLLDCFSYRKNKDSYEVGWGKYYGPILEHGWNGAGPKKDESHSAIPHFYPTWEKNEDKYYKIMINKLGGF